MGFKQHVYKYTAAILLCGSILFFQNCGVQKPKIEEMSSLSIGFSHTPIPNSCIACHAEAVPAVATTLALDNKSDLYFHETSFKGDQDCVSCHAQNVNDIGKTWANGKFDHTDNMGGQLVACVRCHTGNSPVGLVGASQIDHTNYSNQNCFDCHKNTGINWTVGSFSHAPTPTSCVSCHASKRPAITQYYAADSTKPTLDLFVHKTQYGGQNDCVLCHTQNPVNIGKSWMSGVFNHKDNSGVTIANCTECHAGSMPTTPVGTSSFSHSTIGAQDCYSCHKNAGGNWSTTQYSHAPTPTSCISCHSSARPDATKYFAANPSQPSLDLYVHAIQYNGSADCVNCHLAQPANLGVKWAGGNFNHKNSQGATVTDCMNCHSGSRPVTHTAASGQLGDCFSCHSKAGVDWSSTGVPSTIVLQPPTGTQITTSITVKHPTVQSGMSCTTCHSNYNATNSIKGFDHTEGLILASNNTKVGNTSCFYCHFSPGKVIDTTAITIRLNSGRSYVTGQMVQGTVSHKGENLSNHTSCLDCHTSSSAPAWNTSTKSWTTGGKWNGG